MKKIYIYKGFERFWHWSQASLIIFLAITGFEVHGSVQLFGYDKAVHFHRIAADLLLGLIVFAIFWHFTTGEWRQYVPTYHHLKAQLDYYLFGIFKNAPHPTKKTVLSKLNPLQRIVYFGLKMLVIPIIVTSGLFYMFYRYPQRHGVEALNIQSLEIVALVHTAAAFLLVSFIITHLYLITTGKEITSNLKAMFTGFEDLEDDFHNTEEEKVVEEVAEEMSSINNF